jgi:hypothetical protein
MMQLKALKSGKMPAQPAAGLSKRRPPNVTTSTSNQAAQAQVEKPTRKQENMKDKPKPTGKLDFGKGKTKETRKEEIQAEQNKKAFSTVSSTSLDPTSKKEPKKLEFKVRESCSSTTILCSVYAERYKAQIRQGDDVRI